MLPVATMEGRLTREPELRFTPTGKAVCEFTLAANDRRQTSPGVWEDGDPIFIRISVWDKYGENCAESLAKGDLVIVTGRLSNRKWTGKDGEDRYSLEINANDVSVPLRFRTVQPGQRRDPNEVPPAKSEADPWGPVPSAIDDSAPPF